jgi:hypothetical protein
MSRPKQLLRIGARLFTVAAKERARLSVETEPLPSRRQQFQAADPKRFMAPCSFRALHVLGSSGLLSRGFEDQPRDFVGMGDQREMAGLHLDGLGAHPLGHEALKVRIDRAVIR